MQLICPTCGLVELAGTRLCPTCGMTALDDADPANRDAIDEAITLQRQRMEGSWGIAVILVCMAVAFVLGTWFGKDPAVGQLGVYVGLIVGAIAVGRIGRARTAPGWIAAIENHRTASGDRALRRARWTSTTAIAAAICFVFVGIQAIVGIDALDFRHGDETTLPWRIVTSSFTHAGAMHLLGNMLALFLFGLAVDLRVGRIPTAIILAAAAIAGALVQAQFITEPMVGFSGAIYGLIGATLVLMPTRPALLTFQGAVIPIPTWLWTLLLMPVFTFTAYADEGSHVGYMAHLGGFFAGLLVAIPMRRLPPTPAFARNEELRRARIEQAAAR